MGKIKLEIQRLGNWNPDDECFDGELPLRDKQRPSETRPLGRKAKTLKRRAIARGWKPPFLRIPTEARVKILEYVLPGATVHYNDDRTNKHREPFECSAKLVCPEARSLLLTCKQLNFDCHAAIACSVQIVLGSNAHLGQLAKSLRGDYFGRLQRLALRVPRIGSSYAFLDGLTSLRELTVIHSQPRWNVWGLFFWTDPFDGTRDRHWVQRAKLLPMVESGCTNVRETFHIKTSDLRILHQFSLRSTSSFRPGPQLDLTYDVDTDQVVKRVARDRSGTLETIWENGKLETWSVKSGKAGMIRELLHVKPWI